MSLKTWRDGRSPGEVVFVLAVGEAKNPAFLCGAQGSPMNIQDFATGDEIGQGLWQVTAVVSRVSRGDVFRGEMM